MQTNLADFIKDTPQGREAEAILRKCVHCGFCTATCPTYQLLGDELDGPRGRIYLIKQVLEGEPRHRRRRSCTSTAASPAARARPRARRACEYGRLRRHRPRDRRRAGPAARPAERASRYALSKGLRSRSLFGAALAIGRATQGPAPPRARARVPDASPAGAMAAAAPRAAHADPGRLRAAVDRARRSTRRWRACSTASASPRSASRRRRLLRRAAAST